MQENQEKKTKSLPKSDDSFWNGAVVELMPDPKEEKCLHTFKQIDKHSIQCTKCLFGLKLDYKDEFKDGHLYRDNKLII